MNDIAFLELTTGGYTIVDADLFPELNKNRWSLGTGDNVCQNTDCYIPNSGDKRRTVLLHRVVNQTPKGKLTDHINANRLDNRRCNLRTVNDAQNKWNGRKRKKHEGQFTSQYKGVHYVVQKGRSPKWAAFNGSLTTPGKRFIGYFGSEKEAAIAYDNEARKRFGEYAHTNFPPGETAPVTPKPKRGRPPLKR